MRFDARAQLKRRSYSAALAQSLRSLSHDDFMKLIKSTCLRLAAAVDVAAVHSSVLLELVDSFGTAKPADTRAALALDLGDTVHGAAELANLRFSKIVGVRSETHAALDLRDFAQLFHEAWAFVVQCEVACQRMIVGLRGVLVGQVCIVTGSVRAVAYMLAQAKAFLQSFHNARVAASAHLVEVEQWQPADVPSSVQATVDDIINGAVHDPKTFMLNGNAATAPSKASTAKHLVIEERNYFAVAACVKSLETLADYIRVVLNLPLLATDAMSRIVEFLKVRLRSVCLNRRNTAVRSNSTLAPVKSSSALARCVPPVSRTSPLSILLSPLNPCRS